MAVRVLQYLFALLYLATSLGKLLNNRGFAEVLGTYRLFPSGTLMVLALSISLGELYLGLRLLTSSNSFRLACVTVLVHGAYMILALVTLYRGIALTNCGCFGVFLARPLTWMTPVEDGVIVVFSLVFAWLAKETQ